ncbi:hypothetical protein ACFX10_021880 [Malus domestica]
MPYAFIDLARVTISHISTKNVSAKIDVPNVRRTSFLKARDAILADPRTLAPSQSSTHKRGRPLGSKDSHPQQRKPMTQALEEPIMNLTVVYSLYPTHEEILDYRSIHEKTNLPPENHDISVHYASLDDV